MNCSLQLIHDARMVRYVNLVPTKENGPQQELRAKSGIYSTFNNFTLTSAGLTFELPF